jgi:predicted lipase
MSVTSAHLATEQQKTRQYQFQTVRQLQQRDTAARTEYRYWFRGLVREGFHVLAVRVAF